MSSLDSEEKGPCPICGNLFPLNFLNAHVNDHLDNDQYEDTAVNKFPLEAPLPFHIGRRSNLRFYNDKEEIENESNNNNDNNVDDDTDNGFDVICPYPGCGGKLINAKVFPEHVFSMHIDEENHSYLCPICELMGYVKITTLFLFYLFIINFNVKEFTGKDLNLPAHLRSSHENYQNIIRNQRLLSVKPMNKLFRIFNNNDDDDDNNNNNSTINFIVNNNHIGDDTKSGSSSISSSISNSSDDDDDDDDSNEGVFPIFKKISPPPFIPEEQRFQHIHMDEKPMPEKSWEEKEEEIKRNTFHTVLEKDMDETETCTICLDYLKKGQKVTILGCLCKFHEECFNDYMATDPPNACPTHHKY